MNMLIFGVGNPYRGDDSIGIKVAEELKNKFETKKDSLNIYNGNPGVFSLLDLSRDYSRLVIIDAVETFNGKTGTVKFLRLSDLNICSSPFSHCVDLKTAWFLWKKKFENPKFIDIFAIQIKDKIEYKDSLSPILERKFSDIIKEISQKLKLEPKLSCSA